MAHHLTPRDVVPALRSDLSINRPPLGNGAEVIRVTGTDLAMPYAMRGFEFSIARMLDGKRTAAEVMENAERIGLPVDLHSLDGLVHQLEAHGLIADEHHPGVGGTHAVRRARPVWSPEIRELYREALRDARAGHLASAKQVITRLLEIAPGTFEAIALEDWLQRQTTTTATGTPFRSLLQNAEASWRSAAVPFDKALTRPVRPARSVTPFLVMAAGLIAGAVAVTVPLPRVALASAHFAPVATAPVLSGHEGTIDTVLVKEGEDVVRGEELVTFNTDDARVRLAEVKDELEQLRQPLRFEVSKSMQGKPLFATLTQTESAVARAQSALLDAQKANAGLTFDDSITHLEGAFAAAQAQREEARKAIDALVPATTTDAMKIDALTLEMSMLEGQIRDPVLRAPSAGMVRDLNVQVGEHVTGSTELLKLEDTSRLQVVATVTPRVAKMAHVGDHLTVNVDGRAYPTSIDAVNGFEVTTTVNNIGNGLQTGTAPVNLEFTPRALWQAL